MGKLVNGEVGMQTKAFLMSKSIPFSIEHDNFGFLILWREKNVLAFVTLL